MIDDEDDEDVYTGTMSFSKQYTGDETKPLIAPANTYVTQPPVT